MKKLIRKLLLFGVITLIPLIILSLLYLHYDPFRVIKTYRDYSYPIANTNRDMISTSMMLQNRNRYHYNSFIFGSSRTLAFSPNKWKQYLRPGDSPFVYDGSFESIYGMYRKLRLLDSLNVPIDNVLMVICRDASFNHYKNQEGHLFISSPVETGESKLLYQWTFLKAYLEPQFLFKYYSYRALKTYKPFMGGYVEPRKITYDTVTNELRILDQEQEVDTDPSGYYARHQKIFYSRNDERTDTVSRINAKHREYLKDIKQVFEKHHTNYKIVISPLYEQIKLTQNDKRLLISLFGDHVYDFSGRNSFTEPITNYYETSHFRPFIGDSIMRIIYR